jgi:hypothetical protein
MVSTTNITLWLFNIAMENPLYIEVLMGTSSINGPFSMAMLNNESVYTMGIYLDKFMNYSGLTSALA